ncbi:MAG TPA: T9SS type A sorting domain-containing protein, partial [Flavobacteriales bacterium]|nr:T9SS type A sorting domain-containing protein [Flavobacteriales bacterium]
GGKDLFIVRTGLEGTTQLQTVTTSFDATTVEDTYGPTISIHPNPSTGTLTIPTTTTRTQATLLDPAGRVQWEQRVPVGTSRLEFPVPSGMYVLRLVGDDGSSRSARVSILRP